MVASPTGSRETYEAGHAEAYELPLTDRAEECLVSWSTDRWNETPQNAPRAFIRDGAGNGAQG